MVDTASPRIYLLKSNLEFENIIGVLQEKGYRQLEFESNIQQTHEIEILAFSKPNYTEPDWVNLFQKYLTIGNKIANFVKQDLVVIITCKSKNNNVYKFVFAAGLGYYHLIPFFDNSFGVSVLERIFDSSKNKIVR